MDFEALPCRDKLCDRTRHATTYLELVLRRLTHPDQPLSFPDAAWKIAYIADQLRQEVIVLVEQEEAERIKG